MRKLSQKEMLNTATLVLSDDRITRVRRQKVRELMNMGYHDYEIVKILSKGIEIDGTKVDVSVNAAVVHRDMQVIVDQMMANDSDVLNKRVQIIDKYYYLYKQAIKEYLLTNDGTKKSSFLANARSSLDKIAELERVNDAVNPANVNIFNQQNVIRVANEINENPISNEDRNAISAAIAQILESGEKPGRTIDAQVVDREPGVRAHAGDNAGVPGQSGVHGPTGSTTGPQP